MEKTMISVTDACTIMRVMVQIQMQIQRAFSEGRYDDACAMAISTGSLTVKQFDLALYHGPLADPMYHPNGYQETA
jgi:hypothetical protein